MARNSVCVLKPVGSQEKVGNKQSELHFEEAILSGKGILWRVGEMGTKQTG